ncbi:response regulator [Legionella geestiana]|uniref:response regulator n=1 Tax=Legionella geestiana TaxID=45065 RepID=UPI000DFA3CA1|nr:response regulator [Legionella geestiana]STX59195.1 sensory histidine-kinase / response regulator [Legionella geestiana]
MKNREISDNIYPDVVLNAMLSYSGDIAIVIKSNFAIERLNTVSENFYQCSLNDVHGENFLELCCAKHITCPISEHFFNHPEILSFNLDCKNAAGNECNVNWTICPLSATNAEVYGALIIGKDIELKKNNIAYYLNGIIDAIPGCLYWKNCNGYYMGCNNLTAKLAGLSSPHEVVGKTDEELWGEQAANLVVNDTEVITKGVSILVEEKLKTSTGQWMHFTGVKMPLRDENNRIIGIIGNSLDITELKQTQAELKNSMEMAKAANLAKTEFLENMRHDIRTPLTGIVGFADLLKMESDDPHIKEYSENLVASSHALLDLMDEVLEAIRVSSGEIPRLKKKFSLESTFNHVIELNRARAAQKELSLSIEFAEDTPSYMIGDKVRIHRVALELVANALNFTEAGFVKMSVSVARRMEGKIVLKLMVADSGIGIPVEKQQEIYLQFKRLTPSYQGIYKGAGLGLFVVKQFIDELNGEIYVESEAGRGTCFTCLIPLQEPLLDDDSGVDATFENTMDATYVSTITQQIKTREANTHKDTYQVLVVEDNAIAQNAARAILSKMRCTVTIANTGEKAVDLWKNHDYDLIFMDIGLPDIDGYEVTHQIRLHEMIRKTHVPIIALTAHAGDENKQQCITAGMNAVLTKPLSVNACSDILDAFIPGYAPQEPSPALPRQIDTSLLELEDFPLLDVEEGKRVMGGEDNLTEMLDCMIKESLPEDCLRMKKAFSEHDFEKVRKLAHKIKGGAVYVGTTRLKMACQYLEQSQKSGETDLLVPLYEQALNVVEATIHHVSKWLENHHR